MSIVNRRIDAVVSGEVAHLLRQHHFKKDGRTFRKWDGGLCLIVNVQASHGNFGEHGRFYVNLSVYSLALAEQAEIIPQLKPREGHGQKRERLHKGPALADGWWEIGPDTSTDELSAEVANHLELHGLPWLFAESEKLHPDSSTSG